MRKTTSRVLTTIAAALGGAVLGFWIAETFFSTDYGLSVLVIVTAAAAWAGWTGRLGLWLRALFRQVS